ncbi:MAG: tRNA dihydrouridine synthase DusB [Acholeplasmataceae bacterium]
MFKIREIKINNKVVLAPMAGVSNSAFRLLAKETGAGLLYAEMVSDKGLIYQNNKTKALLYMTEAEHPMAQQIFGSDLETMVQAAVFVDQNSNCDIIDINMGCPVPKVALKQQAGASLLKNPALIYQIVATIVKKVTKPVTVKIRSGWDDKSINAVEVAKQIEKAGADAIIVHARTRKQGYSGKADLDVIKAVKENVGIPVIGNGDIVDGPSARKMLDYTGCDAVMIGRAALGNPWIFREVEHYLKTGEKLERPTYAEIKAMFIRHLEALVELKKEHLAVLEMRGQGAWYLKGLKQSSSARQQIVKAKSKEEMIEIIETYFQSLENQ